MCSSPSLLAKVKVVQSSRLHHPPPDDANKPQDNSDDDNDNGDNGDGDNVKGDNSEDDDFVPPVVTEGFFSSF